MDADCEGVSADDIMTAATPHANPDATMVCRRSKCVAVTPCGPTECYNGDSCCSPSCGICTTPTGADGNPGASGCNTELFCIFEDDDDDDNRGRPSDGGNGQEVRALLLAGYMFALNQERRSLALSDNHALGLFVYKLSPHWDLAAAPILIAGGW